MHSKIDVFHLTKAGNSPSDYEDAFWPRKPLQKTLTELRLAVADGATEASFSVIWARLLVRAYGTGMLSAEALLVELRPLQDRWSRIVARIVASKPLPWYAEEKLRDGTFSSLLGLTIEDSVPRTWKALAVGDSCLFQVRGEEPVAKFPLDGTEQFNNRPVLLSSTPARNSRVAGCLKLEGRWEDGDVFYLMTDAMARWLLRRWELRAEPLCSLKRICNEEDFESFIREQRQDHSDDGQPMLKNDDVTFMRCTIYLS